MPQNKERNEVIELLEKPVREEKQKEKREPGK